MNEFESRCLCIYERAYSNEHRQGNKKAGDHLSKKISPRMPHTVTIVAVFHKS